MPDGGDWNGRYHSKQYGELEVTVKGGFARGVLQATGSKLELGGSVEGDLWRYGWTELNRTTNEIRHGRGYLTPVTQAAFARDSGNQPESTNKR
jgi:hypothetical protein